MKIHPVAVNTFKEAVRDKILYVILIFSILTIGSVWLINPLSLGEFEKITKDLGLASISFFGLLISIFVGTRLVYEEIAKKTLYTILPKPVERWEFILGKYFGLMLVLLLTVTVMTIFFFLITFFNIGEMDFNLLSAIFLTFIELGVITAIAVFFSTFISPILSAIFTVGIFIAGHLSRDLNALAKMTESSATNVVCKILYYILPNLSNFNVRGEVVHRVPITVEYLLLSVLYGVVYCSIVLIFSIQIFKRKNF